MLRTRGLLGLMLGAAWLVHGCGRSERTVHPGDDSTAGTASELGGSAGRKVGGGGSAGLATTGGSAGRMTTGGGGVSCDSTRCENGRILIGPCSSSPYTACDPPVNGVECVASGLTCPTSGSGGTSGTAGTGGTGNVAGGGTGGVGGPGSTGGVGGAFSVDCFRCVNGTFQYTACPSTGYVSCNVNISGVSCVASGRCPILGEGGAGGEGGGS